jgi:hypothetical protein
MKTYVVVDVQILVFLTYALVGGERSASRPGCFTLKERPPSTHWILGWVAPEPGWTIWIGKNSLSYRGSNSDPSVFQPTASRYTDCSTATLAIQTIVILINVLLNISNLTEYGV